MFRVIVPDLEWSLGGLLEAVTAEGRARRRGRLARKGLHSHFVPLASCGLISGSAAVSGDRRSRKGVPVSLSVDDLPVVTTGRIPGLYLHKLGAAVPSWLPVVVPALLSGSCD